MSCSKFLKQLVQSDVIPDKPSHNKFWSNVGMAAMTVIFIYMGCTGTLPEWYAWIYAPTVACPQLISKFITLRWGWKCQHSDRQYPYDEYSDSGYQRYPDDEHPEYSGNRHSDPIESEDHRELRR